MDDSQSAPQGPPLHAQLIHMGTSYWISAIVYAAAKLGLADQLAAGPKSAAELAGPARVHAPSLHRLMRTLASLGILTEGDEQRFALTPLGEALKTGAPARPGHLDCVRQPSVLACLSGDLVFRGDGEDRVRKSRRQTDFRLPGAPSGRSVVLQRGHGRLPWRRTAGGRCRVRLLPLQDGGGRRRCDGQHAGGDPHSPCRPSRRAVRPATCGARCSGITPGARRVRACDH